MPYLLTPSRPRWKPLRPRLDRTHPLASRIGFYAVPGLSSQLDLVNGTMGVLFGGSLNGPTPVGEGFQSTSNTVHGLYWPFPRAFDPDGDGQVEDFTIAIFARWASWPNFGKLICFPYRQDTSWSGPFASLALSSTGDTTPGARMECVDTTNGTNTGSNLSNYMVAGRPAAYVVTRSGTSLGFWRDNVLIGSPTVPRANPIVFTGTGGSARPNLYLCQRNHQNPDEGCQATVLAAGLWPRVLSNEEIRLWSADPFALVRPAPIKWYWSTSAGGSSTGTLTVSLDGFGLTGSATHAGPASSTGTASNTLGNVTLAGSATFVSAAASTGSLSATLGATTLTGSATFTASGAATGSLSVTTAAVTMTGAATFTAAGASSGTLSSTLGAVTLTGSATFVAAALASGSLSSTLGSVTLTGSATAAGPGVVSGTLTTTLGSFTLTGSATAGSVGGSVGTLSTTLERVTLTGAATHTGPVGASGSLSVTLGSVTLVGQVGNPSGSEWRGGSLIAGAWSGGSIIVGTWEGGREV